MKYFLLVLQNTTLVVSQNKNVKQNKSIIKKLYCVNSSSMLQMYGPFPKCRNPKDELVIQKFFKYAFLFMGNSV